ncbi:hypothetical protein ABMA27_007326, partial [Loxostege sticticalis]
MPKRKVPRSCEEELEHLMRKMRKLEKKIHATNPIEELPSPEHVTECTCAKSE